MKLSFVMPVYNQEEYTIKCVESIIAAMPAEDYEIIAVDNGSLDGNVKYLKSKCVTVIENAANLGVARAWNAGIKKAKAPMIAVINNDIIITKNTVQPLLNAYEKAGRPGIVSPGTREGILNYDPESYSAEYVRKMKGVRRGGFSGWFMLISAERFRQIGLFSEDFETGIGEDTDFYLRLRKAGYNSFITGDSFVHHFGSRTIAAVKEEKGAGFEKKNINALREKWGAKARTGFIQRAANSIDKRIMKALRGHTLVEK